MTDRTLKSKVSTLQQLQAEIDTLTAEAETLKDAIKAEMTVRAVDELEAGNAVIRWKPIPREMRPRGYPFCELYPIPCGQDVITSKRLPVMKRLVRLWGIERFII